MNGNKIIEDTVKYLNNIAEVRVGDIITEYDWRESCNLILNLNKILDSKILNDCDFPEMYTITNTNFDSLDFDELKLGDSVIDQDVCGIISSIDGDEIWYVVGECPMDLIIKGNIRHGAVNFQFKNTKYSWNIAHNHKNNLIKC